MLVGLYLLFMASVGYVRYFGGAWGGALQLGLIFVAVVLAIGVRCRVHCARHAAGVSGQAFFSLPL